MQNQAAPKPISESAVSESIVSGLLRAADVAIVVGVAVAAFLTWHFQQSDTDWHDYWPVVLLAAVLAVNLFHLAGAYRFTVLTRANDALLRILVGWLAVAAALLVASFLTKTSSEFSRGWSVLWFSGTLLLLSISRLVVAALIDQWTRQGRLCRSVAVVGAGALGQRLLRHFAQHPDPTLRIVGIYDDRIRRLPSHCLGMPILGDLDDLLRDARQNQIDKIVLALPLAADRRLTSIMARLRPLPVDVCVCLDRFGLQIKPSAVTYLDGLTLLNILDKPLAGWRLVAKQLEDRLLASFILLLIMPVMLAIALAIKLDSPGPVFFRQRRWGFNNQLIEIYKFRTMYHDMKDQNAEQLTRRNDPRVTRVGAFLRRTSLDELPQFINVLRGDMSVVGPRPHALAAKADGLLYQDAVREYAARHRVKPGITGWAQVNGWRGETATLEQIEKRVEHDLFYIDNWSILLDLKIVLRTIFGGFTGRYAY